MISPLNARLSNKIDIRWLASFSRLWRLLPDAHRLHLRHRPLALYLAHPGAGAGDGRVLHLADDHLPRQAALTASRPPRA
jgi:hypothetical protein